MKNKLQIIKSQCSLTKIDIDSMHNKDIIHQKVEASLVHSISTKILSSDKFSMIPVSTDDISTFSFEVGVIPASEINHISNDLAELEMWREKFKSHQDIINRAILEKSIEKLL